MSDLIVAPGKADYELLAAFRYAVRLYQRFSEDAARAIGIEPQQHQALLAVKGYPGRDQITVGELAERLQVRHNSAVGLVNRLVTLKLLERVPAPDDRRRVFLRVTVEGDAVLRRLATTHQAELRRQAPELVRLLTRLAGQDGSSPA
jgi:DNA-binding MarR family transcriptional regulator